MANDGLAPLSEAPSLEGLSTEDRIDAMVLWFFDNFEDPAHETPYDGREGGYQYIHGGPYEAQDYVPYAFPDATEKEHQEAIDRIDSDGPDWAPAGHRIIGPDEADYEVEPPLSVRLEKLGSQLEIVSQHIQTMRAIQEQATGAVAGIGHNNPPADEDEEPDLHQILQSIDEVKQELTKPNREVSANAEVIEKAEARFTKFLKWVGKITIAGVSAVTLGFCGKGGEALFEYMQANHSEIVTMTKGAADILSSWAAILSPF